MLYTCKYCKYVTTSQSITSTSTGKRWPIVGHNTCESFHVVYVITCPFCKFQYVGQTGRNIRKRLYEHLRDIRIHDRLQPVASHFLYHDVLPDDLLITIVDNSAKDKNSRLRLEEAWIRTLDTITPASSSNPSTTPFSSHYFCWIRLTTTPSTSRPDYTTIGPWLHAQVTNQAQYDVTPERFPHSIIRPPFVNMDSFKRCHLCHLWLKKDTNSILNHLNSEHGDTGKGMYKCPVCFNHFTRKWTFKRHYVQQHSNDCLYNPNPLVDLVFITKPIITPKKILILPRDFNPYNMVFKIVHADNSPYSLHNRDHTYTTPCG